MCNFLILLLFTNKTKLLDIFMNRVYFDSCTVYTPTDILLIL